MKRIINFLKPKTAKQTVASIELLEIGPHDLLVIKLSKNTPAEDAVQTARYIGQWTDAHGLNALVSVGDTDFQSLDEAAMVTLGWQPISTEPDTEDDATCDSCGVPMEKPSLLCIKEGT